MRVMGRLGEAAGLPVRRDAARHDGVDGDAARRQFDRKRLGQADKARLCGHDMRPVRSSAVPGHPADIDDARALFHDLRGGLRTQERRIENARHDRAPFGE
jgi:hypothetical protein